MLQMQSLVTHNTAYASALFGIAHDLDTNRISGIEVINVGGGVYREKQISLQLESWLSRFIRYWSIFC